jgi:hypothetical protein
MAGEASAAGRPGRRLAREGAAAAGDCSSGCSAAAAGDLASMGGLFISISIGMHFN